MNIRRIIVIAFIFLVSCQNQDPEIKYLEQVNIERYRIYDENLDSTLLTTFIIQEIDSNGLEKKSTYYSADSSIQMAFENSYTNGNKTRVNWINAGGEMIRYVLMDYNESKQLIESRSYNTSDELISGFTHRWRGDGKIEEKGPLDTLGNFKANAIYEYNEQMETTQLTEYSPSDSLYGTFQWQYLKFNEEGEWTERTMTFNDRLVRLERKTFQYSSKK